MQIEFDAAKQAKTLAERGLDFGDAARVFAVVFVTIDDQRADYGEQRFITVGQLGDRVLVLVWTPRGAARRIISMRYANEREFTKYSPAMG